MAETPEPPPAPGPGAPPVRALPPDGHPGRSSRGLLGLLIFVFGMLAGLLAAFSGLQYAERAGATILLVFLIVLVFVAAFGVMIYVFRKPILQRLFGYASTEVELFARPLSAVAKGAVDRDPVTATDAARELVQLSLARWAWLSTRRWIIGSLTALIAAMAALAGTVLLFNQNELLREQSALIA